MHYTALYQYNTLQLLTSISNSALYRTFISMGPHKWNTTLDLYNSPGQAIKIRKHKAMERIVFKSRWSFGSRQDPEAAEGGWERRGYDWWRGLRVSGCCAAILIFYQFWPLRWGVRKPGVNEWIETHFYAFSENAGIEVFGSGIGYWSGISRRRIEIEYLGACSGRKVNKKLPFSQAPA